MATQPDLNALINSARNPSERLLRLRWLEEMIRSTSGMPMVTTDFVSQVGRSVRLIDVRDAEELTGPLGHIPGSDWVAPDKVETIAQLPPTTPIIIISRTGERGGHVAQQLEGMGMQLVAAMAGGMVAWKNMGLAVSREPAVLTRGLRPVTPPVEDAPASEERKLLTHDQIQAHIGDVQTVRWLRMATFISQGRASCVDGREDQNVIGTPGGDAGEFLLQLASVERVTGKAISLSRLPTLLYAYVDAFGHFYLHSDITAMNALIKSMRADPRLTDALRHLDTALLWRDYMRSPPLNVREAILEHMVMPEHVGCGHLRLIMQNPDRYGVRRELAQEFYRTFIRMRWDGSVETEFVTLGGGHREGAVVNVRLAGDVHVFTRVPLISPAYDGVQMFVNHPQVSSCLREQAAHFMSQQGHLLPLKASDQQALVKETASLASQQLTETLGALANGLPVYTVTFDGESHFTVTDH